MATAVMSKQRLERNGAEQYETFVREMKTRCRLYEPDRYSNSSSNDQKKRRGENLDGAGALLSHSWRALCVCVFMLVRG